MTWPVLVAALAAPPDEPKRSWDPGNPTTSSVRDEVRADDVESSSDGVYGRFDNPFDWGLHLGAEIHDDGAAGAARTTLHYFSMAGIYAGYADAFGSDALEGSRILSFGVDLRPAFIPRWSKNWEQGSNFLDLAVDSISLGIGAYFRTPNGGSFGERRGFELSLGFGLPLLGRAAGPWVGARSLFRWEESNGGSSVVNASLLATLGWQFAMGG
jgi:hypothetical protein